MSVATTRQGGVTDCGDEEMRETTTTTTMMTTMMTMKQIQRDIQVSSQVMDAFRMRCG